MCANKRRHLVLKHKWFEMIKSGKKREEYRRITSYWLKRIPFWSDFDIVVFHDGYTSITIEYEITDVTIGYGNPDIGAPVGEEVLIIKFKDV